MNIYTEPLYFFNERFGTNGNEKHAPRYLIIFDCRTATYILLYCLFIQIVVVRCDGSMLVACNQELNYHIIKNKSERVHTYNRLHWQLPPHRTVFATDRA